MERNVKHLLLRKSDALKLRFSRKKTRRNALTLKGNKVQDIFGGIFILTLSPSAVFLLQTVSQISFKLFCLGNKRLL